MSGPLSRLLAAATDEEETTIRRVAVRAGLLWLCGCSWSNTADRSDCEACGQGKADPAVAVRRHGEGP